MFAPTLRTRGQNLRCPAFPDLFHACWSLTSEFFIYRRLQSSTRLALETEDQGAQILASLQRQREQIQGASDTVRNYLLVSLHSFVWRPRSRCYDLIEAILPYVSLGTRLTCFQHDDFINEY